MKKLEEVLHKPTSPPKNEQWHIVIQGHPDELLDALAVAIEKEPRVIQTAELTTHDELLICLNWIGEGLARLLETDILDDSHKRGNEIHIKHNGRGPCHGHNMPSQTS